MPKKILTPNSPSLLPSPGYPFSAGTEARGFVYCSGQVAWNEAGDLVGQGDVAAQTRQVLRNIGLVLDAAGASFDDVVKCTVFLADIRYFQAMNAVFAEFFPIDPPARTTVQAALAPQEMLVEIEAVAYVGTDVR